MLITLSSTHVKVEQSARAAKQTQQPLHRFRVQALHMQCRQ
jgi:hypothetical protein